MTWCKCIEVEQPLRSSRHPRESQRGLTGTKCILNISKYYPIRKERCARYRLLVPVLGSTQASMNWLGTSRSEIVLIVKMVLPPLVHLSMGALYIHVVFVG